MTARLALVLHAHLPYVRHPEHARSLEERWLYEAILECYLPLIEVFDELTRDRVPFAITMTLTPPLVCMLQDALLQERFEAYLERTKTLAEHEMVRLYGNAELAPVATFYQSRLTRLGKLWHSLKQRGGVVGALRAFWDQGSLDLIACSATHAYLPGLLQTPRSLRAQVALGMDGFERMVGRRARGMWLPECAYHPDFDPVLRDNRVHYTLVDGHAIAEKGSATSVLPRMRSSGGTMFYGRDAASSEQVWSREGGYPGDLYYRDFYRDIGFDNEEADLNGELGPFKTRVMTGLKYYRITGKDVSKLPYQPGVAKERAWSHALDFVKRRVAQARTAPQGSILVAPYDAELFGHWWFEGPMFIGFIFRHLAHQSEISPTTLAADLDRASHAGEVQQNPQASSWGEGGYGEVWVGRKSAALWRHVHHASNYVTWLLDQPRMAQSDLHERALSQMIRELLLLQSSDWAFILHTDTSTGYANARVRAHVHRLRHLGHLVQKATLSETDASFIDAVSERDAFLTTMSHSELRTAYEPRR
jgi:1,4-alpha-glucan branching enzyme